MLTESDIRASPPRAAIAAITLALLPLCGANGLIPAFPVALWFLWECLKARKQNRGTEPAVLILTTGAAVMLLITVLYLIGYQRPSWFHPSPGVFYNIVTAIKCVAFGWGPAAAQSWFLSTIARS